MNTVRNRVCSQELLAALFQEEHLGESLSRCYDFKSLANLAPSIYKQMFSKSCDGVNNDLKGATKKQPERSDRLYVKPAQRLIIPAVDQLLLSWLIRVSIFSWSSILLNMNALLPASLIEQPTCQHSSLSSTMNRS